MGLVLFYVSHLQVILLYKIHNRVIGFNTLIVGSNHKAIKLYHDLKNEQKSSGHIVKGFLSLEKKSNYKLGKMIPHLGEYKQITHIVKQYNIEDIIIAIETSEHNKIEKIINDLELVNVNIKVIPDMYDILSGTVKINSILGTPLIEIKHKFQTPTQYVIKRLLDIVFSILALFLFMPLFIACAILVKLLSSPDQLFTNKNV